MITETLILIVGSTRYKVTLENYDTVNKSDIAVLLHKSATDVWRWARFHRAKVYFESYQPTRVV